MMPFHYAFKVKDLESTRRFYIDILKCHEGRSSDTWIDFDFFGHQLSAHVSENIPALDYCGQVDGVSVPIPHFGCIIDTEVFEKIAKRLMANNIQFVVKPQMRFEGKAEAQKTMFIVDYSNNPIEFKCFFDANTIFQA
jgi:extradiol dioxygenase family protein